MIDLIIPYYNNPHGLYYTLKSINSDVFYTTVIDDASTETLPLYPMEANQIFRYAKNRGPGYARQHGIDRTSNPYIMFIDTGDLFVSKEIQQYIADTIAQYPDTNMFMFEYYYKDKITDEQDNRLHGKVYKRSFLEKYGITFCPESSYMDEDIGFNRTCRIISEAIEVPIKFIHKPVVRWIYSEDSLTQHENGDCLYRDQTRALSLVTIHTIEICRKNNIDCTKEINQIAISLFYWFIRTAAEREQYMQDAWSGAHIFYKKYYDELQPNTLILGNPEVKKCVAYKGEVRFPINILRFVKDQKDEIMPTFYLTKV